MKRNAIIQSGLAASIVTMLVCIGVAQNTPSAKSPYTEKGQRLFNKYCATCHGMSAKGEGPVAAALKIGPPDLTTLQQPGEKFPFFRVQTKIDGEKEVTAHGTSKMPVWGTIFRRTSGELQHHADIYALVKYIESIQRLK